MKEKMYQIGLGFWRQSLIEIKFFDYHVEIKPHCIFNKLQDLNIDSRWYEQCVVCSFKFLNPDIETFHAFSEKIFITTLTLCKGLHSCSHDREESHSNKLKKHRKYVFDWSITSIVAVTYSGNGFKHPVKTKYIFLKIVVADKICIHKPSLSDSWIKRIIYPY